MTQIVVNLTPPQLNPPVASTGQRLVLSWPFDTLLQAANDSGPWTTVTNATSPYTNSMAWPQQFFLISNP